MSTRRNVLKLIAGAAIVGSVAGSLKVVAQVRAVAQTVPPATDRIALKGYDPVAYFTLSTPTPGMAEYDYVYDGVRYFFANARHRDLFKANPEKYAPQFGGSCANNVMDIPCRLVGGPDDASSRLRSAHHQPDHSTADHR